MKGQTQIIPLNMALAYSDIDWTQKMGQEEAPWIGDSEVYVDHRSEQCP
jgi:hypothetical protein